MTPAQLGLLRQRGIVLLLFGLFPLAGVRGDQPEQPQVPAAKKRVVAIDPVAFRMQQRTGSRDAAPQVVLPQADLVEPPLGQADAAQPTSESNTAHPVSIEPPSGPSAPPSPGATAGQAKQPVGALLEVAPLAQQRGLSTMAARYHLKAVESYPNSAVAWNDLGQFYLSQQQYAKAAQACATAVRLDPESRRYHNNAGIALTRGGHLEEGLREFERAVGAAAAHYNAGVVLLQQGKKRESIGQMRLALTKDPNFKQARTALTQLAPAGRMQQSGTTKQRAMPAQVKRSVNQKGARSQPGKVGLSARSQQRLPFLRWPTLGRERSNGTPPNPRIANKPKKESRGGLRAFFQRLLPSRSSGKSVRGVVTQTSASKKVTSPVAGSKAKR